MPTATAPRPVKFPALRRGTVVLIDGRSGADYQAKINRREVMDSRTGTENVVYYQLVGSRLMVPAEDVLQVIGQ